MADFKRLIKVMENYLGPSAGFVVYDIIKRMDKSPSLMETHHIKNLADILCDEVLGDKLSNARSKVLKSKLYSILGINNASYANELEYWQ